MRRRCEYVARIWKYMHWCLPTVAEGAVRESISPVMVPIRGKSVDHLCAISGSVPGVKAINATKIDNVLHLSQLDTCYRTILIVIWIPEIESEGDCLSEIILAEDFFDSGYLRRIVDQGIRTKSTTALRCHNLLNR